MEWENSNTSALNDMLRDELAQSFIDNANAAIKYHRSNAARFAECGNHESAMAELAEVNEQRRKIAYWREAMETESATLADEFAEIEQFMAISGKFHLMEVGGKMTLLPRETLAIDVDDDGYSYVSGGLG